MPDVVKVFADTGQDLPLITILLISASEGFQRWWPVIFGFIFLGAFGVKYALRRPGLKLLWHRYVLKLPVFGRFSRTMNAARFASTLSILTRSGVSLVEALVIAGQVLSNEAIRAAVVQVAKRVSEGTSLNRSLTETGYFPPLMLHMIAQW